MYRPLVTLAALLALTSCSTPAPASVGLKDSCEALAVVLADFGQVAPTVQRYVDFTPKVAAIHDRGDAATKAALQPLVAAMDKGLRGDAGAAMVAQAAATMALVPQCAAVGASLSTPSATPTPTPTETETPEPTKDDFELTLKITGKECFGSAGCNVETKVSVSYVGIEDLEDLPSNIDITFDIKGGEDPYTATIEMEDGKYSPDTALIQTKSSKSKLTVKITDVDSY